MKIIFVCALLIEALPIIQRFNLKPLPLLNRFRVYAEDEYVLIISGTGKIKSAIATALILKENHTQDLHIINFGFCGSLSDPIGSVALIHKIKDNETNHSFYPDILLKSKIKQKRLVTSSQLVLKHHSSENLLYDMEGSAFFESAQFFLPFHQIHLLKVVSDNLDQTKLDKSKMQKILENSLQEIEAYLFALKKSETLSSFFSFTEEQLIQNLFSKIHLTVTEQNEFKNHVWDILVQKEITLKEFMQKIDLILEFKNNQKELGVKVKKFVQNYRDELF